MLVLGVPRFVSVLEERYDVVYEEGEYHLEWRLVSFRLAGPGILVGATFNCPSVNGASGAQSLRTSTRQTAARALTPASLCWIRLRCASELATSRSEFGSMASWSMSISSLESRVRRPRSSPRGIGFPGFQVRGSSNRRCANAAVILSSSPPAATSSPAA